MYNNLGIFENVTFMEEDVLNELTFSPMSKELKTLEAIKYTDADMYKGPREVKEFVDKNYNDIKKCTDILRKEPEEINKVQSAYIIGLLINWLSAILPLPFPVIRFVLHFLFHMISSILVIVSMNTRRDANTKSFNDILEIKTKLKVLKKKKGIDQSTINKIDDLIESIDNTTTMLKG